MIYLILFAALILRLTSLNQSFWLDEAAQATISQLPLKQINFSVDFQPPFYYLFTHFWQQIGVQSENFLRFPSVFFGVLTIFFFYRFAKRILNHNAALVASFLLATSSYHIYFSQEYRMYSLLTLLILISWYLLWEIEAPRTKSPRILQDQKLKSREAKISIILFIWELLVLVKS